MQTLIAAVGLRKALESEIKNKARDLDEQIATLRQEREALLGELPSLLKETKRAEDDARRRVEASLTQAHAERQRILESGEECPPIPIPANISLVWSKRVSRDRDLTDEEAVELYRRGLLTANEDRIKESIGFGPVPGYSLQPKLGVRVR